MSKVFDLFLEESRKVRLRYQVWIERHPDRKEELEKEMNVIISGLLEECEKKEKGYFTIQDKMKEYGISRSVKYLPKRD